MNYFELFDIPITPKVDKTFIAKKYLELQKKFHPDFYTDSTTQEQEQALEISSIANKALTTFQSQDATIRYLLQIKGLLEEEEKYALTPAFLMEVMELNEMKMNEEDPDIIKQRTLLLEKEIDEAIRPTIEQYNDNTINKASLLQLKEYYYKKKYLEKLKT